MGKPSIAVALALSVCGAAICAASPTPLPVAPPKLILQITVDQLRGDLPDKYSANMGDGGFRYLMALGIWYANPDAETTQKVYDNLDLLGSGVIDGVECNYMALRKEEVDLQIWIAPGAAPYPCRYVITSKLISGSPEYSIQTRDWKTGDAVAATDFSFDNASKAKKIDPKELEGAGGMPANFKPGAKK